MRQISTNSTDKYGISSSSVQNSRWISPLFLFIQQSNPGGFSQHFSSMLYRQFIPSLNMQCLGMSVKHGDTNTGRIYQYIVIFKYLCSFPNHFHFFFRIAIFLKCIDLWNCIECYLHWMHVRFCTFCIKKVCCLFG